MEYKIKDYWCSGCGLIGNFEFACPYCGSTKYSVADYNLSSIEDTDKLIEAYEQGRLHAERKDGKVCFYQRPLKN